MKDTDVFKKGKTYFTEIRIGVIGKVYLIYDVSGMNATIRYTYQGESHQHTIDKRELFETEIECRNYFSRVW